ncbi:glycosyltransferase family 4 protein [Akkermansiaceae bacterium]|nr:glycosyltransferase family 4 protein [Akkermansiaceae bacterium]
MAEKIKIITAFFPPEKGAAPHRIHTTAKELSSYGFDVSVITTLANYPTGKLFNGYKKLLYKKEKIEGIDCIRCWVFPSNSSNPIIRILSMLSYCSSLIFTIPSIFFNRPDIILVQTPPLLPGVTGVLISKLLRIKVILNVSDIWPLTAVELGVMGHKSFSFRFFSWIEAIMYRLSDAMIGQSNETCSYLKEKSDKPILLYRNLTKPFFSKEVNDQVSHHKRKIVYAGLLGYAQGVFNICKNIDFKSLNIEFHIYGDGIEKNLIETFSRQNPDCNIFLHQTLTKDEMENKLPSFDATIIPLKKNIYGAFPSKITMAMAAGLPILFSGDGEGFKIVDEFNLGYVSGAGNLRALEKNIIKFSELNYQQINLMKLNILDVFNNHFNYADQQLKLCEFISSQTLSHKDLNK